jgi:hypothetical protein
MHILLPAFIGLLSIFFIILGIRRLCKHE